MIKKTRLAKCNIIIQSRNAEAAQVTMRILQSTHDLLAAKRVRKNCASCVACTKRMQSAVPGGDFSRWLIGRLEGTRRLARKQWSSCWWQYFNEVSEFLVYGRHPSLLVDSRSVYTPEVVGFLARAHARKKEEEIERGCERVTASRQAPLGHWFPLTDIVLQSCLLICQPTRPFFR